MINVQKQERCSLCEKKLHSFNTQLKKHKEKKICTGCAWKVTKKEMGDVVAEERGGQGDSSVVVDKTRKFGNSLSKIGGLMTLFITIPILIILFLLFL